MIPCISEKDWSALDAGAFLVRISDRSVVKIVARCSAFLSDDPSESLFSVPPVIFGYTVRRGRSRDLPGDPEMGLHYFEADRWCAVDEMEIDNASVGDLDWTPRLPGASVP